MKKLSSFRKYANAQTMKKTAVMTLLAVSTASSFGCASDPMQVAKDGINGLKALPGNLVNTTQKVTCDSLKHNRYLTEAEYQNCMKNNAPQP